MLCKTTQLSVFILCLLLSAICTAQSPVKFTIGKQKYIIPNFKEDSVTGFNNDFVKMGIMPSIKQSQANFEIRVYRWPEPMFTIYNILDLIDDSGKLSLINYDAGWAPNNNVVPFPFEKTNYIKRSDWQLCKKLDSGGYYRRLTYLALLTPSYTLINFLITAKLFALKDEISLLDSFKSQGVFIKTPCGRCFDIDHSAYLLVEIKVANKIRNFRLKDSDYSPCNPAVALLSPYSFIYPLLLSQKIDTTKNIKKQKTPWDCD